MIWDDLNLVEISPASPFETDNHMNNNDSSAVM